MRRFLVPFLLLGVCLAPRVACAETAASSAQEPSKTAAAPQKFSPAQQEVLDARKARHEASEKHDVAAWSRLVADDCIFSDDDGVLKTKAQLMEYFKLPVAYDHSVNLRDYVVHVYGNTAVLNLRSTEHEQYTDSDIISEVRATETYIKQNGSWLLIASQWGNLPVSFRKPVAVDTSNYKDYVGRYEWRPGDDQAVDTVSVKDGKLWSQFGKDVDEYLPAGGETFFIKGGDLGSVTFSRDAQGNVTGYTFHRVDGQEIHAKKIK